MLWLLAPPAITGAGIAKIISIAGTRMGHLLTTSQISLQSQRVKLIPSDGPLFVCEKFALPEDVGDEMFAALVVADPLKELNRL